MSLLWTTKVKCKLAAERGPIIADLREIQKTYSVTDELERTLRELNERMNTEADAVQDLIATNAWVAQNQDDYNVRYEALVSQYEATKAERDRVAAEIRQKGIRRREFERFITTLEKLLEEVTTFEEAMWSSLVDYVTVSGKDDLQFTLACGVEMQA